MTAGRPRRDWQPRRIASDGCVQPVSVRPIGEMEFFLFGGGDEQAWTASARWPRRSWLR
jgi:hypothetical protein